MTVFSTKLETPASNANTAKADQRRSQYSPRRKKTTLRTIRRRLDKMLQMRQIIRAGFVLLPLAGFVYVSLMNVVLSPHDDSSDSIWSERSAVYNNEVARVDAAATVKDTHFQSAAAEDGTQMASLYVQPTASMVRLASAWLPVDLDASAQPSDAVQAYGVKAEPLLPDTESAERGFRKKTIYAVNEGGSLWRTGRRFIADEVLLDKLIDNLADNGMDVRRVRAGMEFVVNDLGSEGLLVVVDDGDETYESRIFGDSVITRMRHRAESRVDSTRTAWLE